MRNSETNPEPALPLCGAGWTIFRSAILLIALSLLIGCASSAKRSCPEAEIVTRQQEPNPPPVILTIPCRPLPAPNSGPLPPDDATGLMLRWAELYAACADRHRRLVGATE